MGSDGPICHFRLTGAESSYCLLKTRRMADAENAIPSLVFHGADETRPVLCGPELAAVCPFRSAGSDHPSKKAMVMCQHCGHRHRPDSNSRQICEAWASTKQVLKQMRTEFPGLRKYYLVGTKQLPYAEDTTDLVRRVLWPKIKSAVLRRDRNICQDCGINFEKGRIKVFDPTLRRGKGGNRWESLEVHHIVPRSRGGSDHPGNLKTLCPACHRRYTNELITDIAQEVRRDKQVNAIIAECRAKTGNDWQDSAWEPRD
jgi:5-methylcytosine-specific restriction endonuclease McrA